MQTPEAAKQVRKQRKPILAGTRIGRLTVVSSERDGVQQRWHCVCLCDCGTTAHVAQDRLRAGITNSCGCLKNEKKPRTSYSAHVGTRLYILHRNMRWRCDNPNSSSYQFCGAKGITLCPEWRNDFMAFYDWAMSSGYAETLIIERIDNNLGFFPANCRWVPDPFNRGAPRPSSSNPASRQLTEEEKAAVVERYLGGATVRQLVLDYEVSRQAITGLLVARQVPFKSAVRGPGKWDWVEQQSPEVYAYLAGFFDGEGCIQVSASKKRMAKGQFDLHIVTSNTDRHVIEFAQQSLGGFVHLSKNYDQPNWAPIWVWIASAMPALAALKAMLPYLRVKKEQALLAIEFQERLLQRCASLPGAGRHIPLTEEEIQWRTDIKTRMDSLKARHDMRRRG